jgi:hypothetical protein
MKLSRKFNNLAQKGGECVIRNASEWKKSGLGKQYGELPPGKMAVCVFNGAVQENGQVILIRRVHEEADHIAVEVRVGILGGRISRPGISSTPFDVKFVADSDKPVKFDYVGMVMPRHRQPPPKGPSAE